jgi:hypothetical protein
LLANGANILGEAATLLGSLEKNKADMEEGGPDVAARAI